MAVFHDQIVDLPFGPIDPELAIGGQAPSENFAFDCQDCTVVVTGTYLLYLVYLLILEINRDRLTCVSHLLTCDGVLIALQVAQSGLLCFTLSVKHITLLFDHRCAIHYSPTSVSCLVSIHYVSCKWLAL